MRNISASQFVVLFCIGVLLFSDFSKIIKRLRSAIKKSKIYKNIRKK